MAGLCFLGAGDAILVTAMLATAVFTTLTLFLKGLELDFLNELNRLGVRFSASIAGPRSTEDCITVEEEFAGRNLMVNGDV
jgi:hypothetical protein